MTYPDDVLKAAREAAAQYWEKLGAVDAHYSTSWAAECREGLFDGDAEVQSACIAIMAERQRCAEIAESYRNTEGLNGRSVASDIKRAILSQQESAHAQP